MHLEHGTPGCASPTWMYKNQLLHNAPETLLFFHVTKTMPLKNAMQKEQQPPITSFTV